MDPLLTTTQLAQALHLAPSTVRHYRAEGRLVPTEQTPGGHARWNLERVRETLRPGRVTGLTVDTFAPAGQSDIRAGRTPLSVVPTEMIALGVREQSAPTGDAAHHRWGGGLLRPRAAA